MLKSTRETHMANSSNQHEQQIKGNKIFWLDLDSIFPNPYQPRREFDEHALADLADSIRQYGILQPITVTEAGSMDDGTDRMRYELIAGERRLRASNLAKLSRIPAIVRVGDNDQDRFELAIIENLQRENLSPLERAQAFVKLSEKYAMTHAQIGKKMGKSREYVSNSIRLLSLPDEIMQGLIDKKITEGHTRPLLMLSSRPDEQMTLYKEIMYKKMSVRESERVARSIAKDRVRKRKYIQDPRLAVIEQQFSETLGTRVSIEKGEVGGKVVIDYFSSDDLEELLDLIKETGKGKGNGNTHAMLERYSGETMPTNTDKESINNNHEEVTESQAEEPITPGSPSEKGVIAINTTPIVRPIALDAPEIPTENKESIQVNPSIDALPSFDEYRSIRAQSQPQPQVPHQITDPIAPLQNTLQSENINAALTERFSQVNKWHAQDQQARQNRPEMPKIAQSTPSGQQPVRNTNPFATPNDYPEDPLANKMKRVDSVLDDFSI